MAVVAVIAVLAMHGLTMNHDAAMASMSTVSPATVADPGHMHARSSEDVSPSAMTHTAG